MSEWLWAICLIPITWPWISKLIFKHHLDWRLVLGQIVFCLLLVIGVYYLGTAGKLHDTEVLNGEVLGKYSEHVSCNHSYSCFCTTSCSGKGNCTTICQTCYEHAYDIDWVVKSNIGYFIINRIDRRGVLQPPRFTQVKIGDPVSRLHSFTNYVKAVSDSLFHSDKTYVDQFKSQIPPYPNKVYDYYYINRVLSIGVDADLKTWNSQLAQALKVLGPKKQANVIVILVNNSDPNYIYGLRGAWNGFKKNDIVVVLGVQQQSLAWVRVTSWAQNDIFNVTLRDSLLDANSLDPTVVIGTISTQVLALFARKPMADYQYLDEEVQPDLWLIIFAGILGILASIGTTILLLRMEDQ